MKYTTVDEALGVSESREAQIACACLDARQVASILAVFYTSLRDGGVDEHPATQALIIYAKRVIGGKSLA